MYADLVSAGRKRSIKERLDGGSAEERRRIMFPKANRQCRSQRILRPAVSYKLHTEDLQHRIRRRRLQQLTVSRSYLPWKLIPVSGTTHQQSVKSEKLAAALHQQPIEISTFAGSKHQLAASSNNLLKYKAVAEPPLNPVPAPLNKISHKKTELSVDRFLQLLGLEKYSIAFKVEEVDMAALKHMTDEDLKTIGLPMGPRKKILLALRSTRQGC